MNLYNLYTNAKHALKNKAKQAVAVATGALAAVPAMAQAAVDVTAITATNTDIVAVGAAVFGAYVAVKAVKLVRRAL